MSERHLLHILLFVENSHVRLFIMVTILLKKDNTTNIITGVCRSRSPTKRWYNEVLSYRISSPGHLSKKKKIKFRNLLTLKAQGKIYRLEVKILSALKSKQLTGVIHLLAM
jgi:hypothetical protein